MDYGYGLYRRLEIVNTHYIRKLPFYHRSLFMMFSPTPPRVIGNIRIQNGLLHSWQMDPQFTRFSYLYLAACIMTTLSAAIRTPDESLLFYCISVAIISIIMPIVALNTYHFRINKKNCKRLQDMNRDPLPDENRLTKSNFDDKNNTSRM